MVVRRRNARLLVDVGENLKAELRVLIKNLYAFRRVIAAIVTHEIRVREQALQTNAHFLAALRARIARERGAAIGDELLEIVRHGVLLNFTRSRTTWPDYPPG